MYLKSYVNVPKLPVSRSLVSIYRVNLVKWQRDVMAMESQNFEIMIVHVEQESKRCKLRDMHGRQRHTASNSLDHQKTNIAAMQAKQPSELCQDYAMRHYCEAN
jgi:hypothetical protein